MKYGRTFGFAEGTIQNKKSAFLFCIVLTYSYLCPRNEQELVYYQRL